jgi:DNA-binding PadR family transcriptional regulator
VPRFRRSNSLALAVLTCLHERPMHPYEVAQTLRHRVKHESIKLNYGSLYSVVEGLAKRQLITAGETFREGRRPERTVYEITDAGRTEMTDWLTDLIAIPVKEYLQFEAGLALIGALAPDEALDALRLRLRQLELTLAQSEATREMTRKAGLPRLFELEGEYVDALLSAEVTFVRGLISDIERKELSGLDLWVRWSETGELPDFSWPADPDG